MTAYELADALLKNLTMEYDCDKYMEQAANTLRQQAKEIELMQKVIDKDTNIIETLRMMLSNRNQIIYALDLK